ncbi:MAG: type II toxin-antitoxin system RelE/ParE family toxin [Cytophagales bacterium]|nr:MAG: type II toxin-antitoxin system RelE/ParE family toxin [Cytophagales bacterium]
MKYEISNRFIKLSKKLSIDIQKDIKEVITEIQTSENLDKFDVKKMVGYTNYYRIRVNKCRIGIKLENNTIFFEAVAKRDEIYKIFP